MKRALCLVAGLVAGAAQAAIAPELPLEQEARQADLIVRGSLGAPQTVTEGAVAWRVYPLELKETVAGDAGRLPQHGGQPALYVWAEAGDLPDWRTGQDAFFLLYTARLDSPLVGYNQGYYPVVNGTVALPEADQEAANRQLPAAPAAPATPLLPVAQAPVAEAVEVPVSQSVAEGATDLPAAELAQTAPEPQPGELPTPADDAPDAPPVTDPANPTLPGLPSAATTTETGEQAVTPSPVASPTAAPSAARPATAKPSPMGTLSVDDFRALLLKARGAQGGAR